MKRTMTRVIAAVLALLLIGTGLPASLAADYDAAGATRFVFSDSDIAVTEGKYDGYKVEGTALTISAAGTYVLSGSCADGSVTVKKGTAGVTLVLNGLTLTSADTAPITCNKSTQVTIVAAAGSVSTLTDSAMNNDETYPDNENAENAVIKCKDGSQVTLGGTGTLNIIANGKNGIKGGASTDEEGEASLTVQDLTLNITAGVDDGLKSDQTLSILSGTVTVSAADDGIKSDYVLNIGASGTDGPTIVVEKAEEGIEGAVINICSGHITVHADEDGVNAANSDLGDYAFELNVYGGTLYVDAQTGDGLDSNGSLTLAGGSVTVFSSASGDNSPLDSETGITLTGGTVLAVGAGNMAETPRTSEQPWVTFGAGMGGFGGPGMGRMGGMGGQNQNGGRDQNGQPPEIPDGGMGQRPERPDGGMGQPPELPDGGMGTRPDMNGQGEMPQMGNQQGGMPQMGGMNGMNMPGSAVSIKAGDTIAIQDSDGKTLIQTKALRDASYVFCSSADLTADSTYTLTINGTAAATASATTAAGMGGPGGPGGMPGANGQGGMPGMPGENGQGTAPGPNGSGTAPGAPGAQGTSGTKRFTDVSESDWFNSYVTELAAAGVIDGYPDGSFRPRETLTWAQAMKLLLCAHGDLTNVTGSAWAETAMSKASELGLCDASQDGAAAISRLDFCRAAAKLFAVQGTADAFPDCSDASVLALAASGVIAGYPDGTFGPEKTINRAEIAKIIRVLTK